MNSNQIYIPGSGDNQINILTYLALAINRYRLIRKLVLLRIFLQYQTAGRSAKVKTINTGNNFLSDM